MKILIIEDEQLLASSLQTLLGSRQYETKAVYHGRIGLSEALTGEYDMIILDVMLPGIDGYEIARRLRASHSPVPILMLTAKTDLMDRVSGLNAGADYYLPKPFDNLELLACVQALLRRKAIETNELSFGNTILNLDTGVLSCLEHPIRLSAREYEVMKLLMKSGERNLSKDAILSQVWKDDPYAVENHVEVYVGFLRRKLTAIHSNVHIVSLRRLGYHLELQEEL